MSHLKSYSDIKHELIDLGTGDPINDQTRTALVDALASLWESMSLEDREAAEPIRLIQIV